MPRTGRPKSDKSKNYKLSSRFTEEEMNEISLYSSLEHMSKSDYLRFAVETVNSLNRVKYEDYLQSTNDDYGGYGSYDINDEDNYDDENDVI